MSQSRATGCQNFRDSLQANRRGFLKVGMLGAGLSLSQLLRSEALAAREGRPNRKETSVIILWMRGGPSHIDMWDPKPEAPVEVRGEFSPIASEVPGILLGEHIPRSAQLMDKWSIVRSMHYRDEDGFTDHTKGDQICFTGYPHGPVESENLFPSCGSVVKKQLQHLRLDLPAYVIIPSNVPGTNSGHFGPAFAPFETRSDPANRSSFSIPNLSLLDGISVDRLGSRQSLLKDIDTLRRNIDSSGQLQALDEFSQQALQMITGPAARQAFDLDSEPQAVRERYGYSPQYVPRLRAAGDMPNWAQRMLLARRLVESGVRLVTVDCRWWDTHDDNFFALKNAFLPQWDQAYTALLEDLDQRGLLDSTLVVAWGEMGRSPHISATAGRDHWTKVFSVAMAGGGVQGGRVVGSSDNRGAAPKDNPKVVQDVLATMYRHVGVNTETTYNDLSGRPHPVLPCGSPIDELF